jgi:hypothetical protein
MTRPTGRVRRTTTGPIPVQAVRGPDDVVTSAVPVVTGAVPAQRGGYAVEVDLTAIAPDVTRAVLRAAGYLHQSRDTALVARVARHADVQSHLAPLLPPSTAHAFGCQLVDAADAAEELNTDPTADIRD